MRRSKSVRRESTRSSARTELTEDEQMPAEDTSSRTKRVATLYDAVAGRVGLNGFLTEEQVTSANLLPSYPEEVLLRRVGAPDELPYGFYSADQELGKDLRLPDSDLLRTLHTYASDYLAANTSSKGQKDFRTFDGSALLALGVLLEEALRDVLGENGDMVFVEPEGMEDGLPESASTKHQVSGRVKLRRVNERISESEDSGEVEEEQRLRKRRKKLP